VLATTAVTIGRLAYAANRDIVTVAAGSLRPWPDGVDAIAIACYAALALGLPLFGYCVMVLDIRAYLRSLRRALVLVARTGMRTAPSWAAHDMPPCLQALDLKMPCTQEQVLAAYRREVKSLHPDRGGNLQQFLRLQPHFEQAMYLASQG
jgi:hypothetical protein